jgi:hypothetical protein
LTNPGDFAKFYQSLKEEEKLNTAQELLGFVAIPTLETVKLPNGREVSVLANTFLARLIAAGQKGGKNGQRQTATKG